MLYGFQEIRGNFLSFFMKRACTCSGISYTDSADPLIIKMEVHITVKNFRMIVSVLVAQMGMGVLDRNTVR
jgi:hypothetical protein